MATCIMARPMIHSDWTPRRMDPLVKALELSLMDSGVERL